MSAFTPEEWYLMLSPYSWKKWFSHFPWNQGTGGHPVFVCVLVTSELIFNHIWNRIWRRNILQKLTVRGCCTKAWTQSHLGFLVWNQNSIIKLMVVFLYYIFLHVRNSSVLEWDGCLKMTVHSSVLLTAQTPSRNTSDQMGACPQVREQRYRMHVLLHHALTKITFAPSESPSSWPGPSSGPR